jgi:hypothetical protein
MGQVSPKLRSVNGGFAHWCPGCRRMHVIPHGNAKGPQWTFNGDVNRPTFSPSVKLDWGDVPPKVCHYFLTDGMLQFCGDSYHHLAGQTVELPNLPEAQQD